MNLRIYFRLPSRSTVNSSSRPYWLVLDSPETRVRVSWSITSICTTYLTKLYHTAGVGEVESPLPLTVAPNSGELRLQSDFELARDNRTACIWQGMISEWPVCIIQTQSYRLFVDQEELMASKFKAAMSKMAIIGHNREDLIDCYAVVPQPVPALGKPATWVLIMI